MSRFILIFRAETRKNHNWCSARNYT